MTAWADIDGIRTGDTAACELVITEQDVDRFAQLSQDVNPLHMDTGVAQGYGFPRRVAHGMLALSAISQLIGTKLPGPGSLWHSQELQFAAPVFVGDRLSARVTVQQVSKGAQIVSLQTEVLNADTGALVLTGSAKVKIPQRKVQQERKTVTERVAIVTGSSRGLGRAIALRLAAAQIKILVHYHQAAEKAHSVLEEIVANGGEAVTFQADLTEAKGVEALYQGACAAFGKVDILVNNATPAILRKPLPEVTWQDFLSYLNLYVQATFRLTQLAVPAMQSQRFGRIVNIVASQAHGVPPPRLAPYIAAKSALEGLSRALAVELAPLGITVNMVAPSLLVTDQTAGLGDRARQLAVAQAPMKRLAELNDVAGAVEFLVGEAAAFITGAVVPVAGGEVMPT